MPSLVQFLYLQKEVIPAELTGYLRVITHLLHAEAQHDGTETKEIS